MPDCLTAECQMGPEEAEGRAPASAAAALILKLPFGVEVFSFKGSYFKVGLPISSSC